MAPRSEGNVPEHRQGIKKGRIFRGIRYPSLQQAFHRGGQETAGRQKTYDAVFPDLHWRVQDIVNAVASSGFRITEMAELPAVDASFWFSYDEMKTKTEEETKDLNDWTRNPMASIPAWLALISQKPPAE